MLDGFPADGAGASLAAYALWRCHACGISVPTDNSIDLYAAGSVRLHDEPQW